jgi:hypothetical protein
MENLLNFATQPYLAKILYITFLIKVCMAINFFLKNGFANIKKNITEIFCNNFLVCLIPVIRFDVLQT